MALWAWAMGQRAWAAARAFWDNLPPGIARPALGIGAALLLLGSGLYFWAARGLPDEQALAVYEPPLPAYVRDISGAPVASFARERRIFLPFNEMPPALVHAFVSAEDKTFFSHGGLDYPGILKAIFTNIMSMGSNKRPVGASTITQQTAKNLLLNSEVSYARKLREAVLAYRIERAFTKEQILELYLNQIFLGRNSYGVQAAAYAYFSRPVQQLTLPEIAYLAVLPKAPANYTPSTEHGRARALARRNWVLGQMAQNGYISQEEAAAAQATPLNFQLQVEQPRDRTGDWYFEDIRRTLVQRYGEQGKYGVYSGGLWVRSSIDMRLQRAAEQALRDALVRFESQHYWRGPADHIAAMDRENWARQLRRINLPVGYGDWRAAVVLTKTNLGIALGFENGSMGRMLPSGAARLKRGTSSPAFRYLKRGDVIAVKKVGSTYELRQIPEIGGGIVVQDPHTGRILAMVGGFDNRRSQFNRATQALRQPGSAIKPFVYGAALESGFTPASIVVDGPYCVDQGRALGVKCFKNFTGGYAGPKTMRWGLEQSRNLMTVRIANTAGMDKVVNFIERAGIGKYPAVLSISLGAGETTVLKLTNAYSILANGGKEVEPSLIDMIQDRHGKVIWCNGAACAACNAEDWDGEAMPRLADRRKQLIDAATAYQVVHMLEGVVERGTAVVLRDLNRPMMGKTGTTNGPTNVWFVGGTPDLIFGVYLGYDQPRPMGNFAQGGTIAAPIFKQFAQTALKDAPKMPFRIPAGIRMVRIDRASGKRVYGLWPDAGPKPLVIWEAFKPESEPYRLASPETDFAPGETVKSDSDFLQSTGGIY